MSDIEHIDDDAVQYVLESHENDFYSLRDVEDIEVLAAGERRYIIVGTAYASYRLRSKNDLQAWFKKTGIQFDPAWTMETLLSIAESEDLDDLIFVITFKMGKNGWPTQDRHYTYLARDVDDSLRSGRDGFWASLKRIWQNRPKRSLVEVKKLLGPAMRSKVIPILYG